MTGNKSLTSLVPLKRAMPGLPVAMPIQPTSIRIETQHKIEVLLDPRCKMGMRVEIRVDGMFIGVGQSYLPEQVGEIVAHLSQQIKVALLDGREKYVLTWKGCEREGL